MMSKSFEKTRKNLISREALVAGLGLDKVNPTSN